MNRTSFLSFDDTSEWNPKLLRQNLYISDEQLKTLNSLPEWAKGDEDSDTQRINKENESTILSTQVSELQSQVSVPIHRENQSFNIRSIEQVQKHLEHIRKLRQSHELIKLKNIKRYYRSSSFNEDLKFNQGLLNSTLKRTLSLSNLNINFKELSSKRLHLESTESGKDILLNETYTLSSGSVERSKEIFSKPVNDNLPSLDPYKRNISIQSLSVQQVSETMEVLTQLPVNVSCNQKDLTSEVTVESQVNEDVSASLKVLSSEISNSCSQINGNKIDDFTSNHAKILSESGQLQEVKIAEVETISCTKAAISASNVQTEERAEEAVHIGAAECGKVESDISASASNVPDEQCKTIQVHVAMLDKMEVDSSKNLPAFESMPQSEQVRRNIDYQYAFEFLKSRISQSLPEEHTLSQINFTSNPDTNANCNSEFAQKSHNISTDKLPAQNNSVTVKRKSDSKKSSKKHKSQEKKGYMQRSVKKAANISYSKEEVENMLNIIKQLL